MILWRVCDRVSLCFTLLSLVGALIINFNALLTTALHAMHHCMQSPAYDFLQLGRSACSQQKERKIRKGSQESYAPRVQIITATLPTSPLLRGLYFFCFLFLFYLFIYFHVAISYLGHSSKRGHLLRFDCSNYFLSWGGELFNKRCQKDASITRTMIFWNTLLKYSVYSRLCSSKFCIFQALMGLKFGLEAGRKQQRRSQEEELKTLRILIPPRSYVNKNTCKLYSWTTFS